MAVSVIEMSGRTIVHDSDSNATAEKDVFGGPCTLHGILANNAHSATEYIKFYDHLDPTVGTTDPDEECAVEASTGLNGGDMYYPINPPNGLAFATGLSFCTEQTAGTSGTTPPGATVEVSLILGP